jgi:glycerate kinase
MSWPDAADPRTQVRVLVAPDSFKGTHSADDVTRALAAGLRDAGVDAVRLPLADGGEGTLDVLRRVLGGAVHGMQVTGPLGAPVQGRFLLAADGRTAVVETASASGLSLVPPDQLDPWGATSRGTGELIAAAAASRPERILVGVGGSATTDGGAGAIEGITAGGGLRGCGLEVLCDVTTPFELAAAVYGPQKGADASMVRRLELRLHELADGLPRDPRGVARTGAAGGLSGGLWATYDAALRPGIDAVLNAVGFSRKLLSVDAVITGEGRLDTQTSEGKVVSGVVDAVEATARPVPVHAVVGQTLLDQGGWVGLGLTSVSIASTREDLIEAGRRLGAELMRRSHTRTGHSRPESACPRTADS